jgi:proline iminopeptidase
MKKEIFRLLQIGLLLFTAIILIKIFWPRKYHVPKFSKRPGTQYWQLPTGSTIGYTLLHAKGPKKTCPIIYLHGGPGGPVSDLSIYSLLPLTEEGYDVYLYDQIGGGESARLENIEAYTPGRHEKDLEAIIKQIGAEKVILVGQSWGAILSVLFIASNPDKVEKLIVTGPGPVPPVNPTLFSIKAPDSLHLRDPYYSNRQGNEKANNIRTKVMAWWARTTGTRLASDEEADNFATYLNYEVNKSTVCDTSHIPAPQPGAGYYVQVMTMKNFNNVPDPRPVIRNLRIPILVMKGQCDNQRWGFTNEYLELFSNHQLSIIPDAGHFIAFEQPELYIKTIREFLQK